MRRVRGVLALHPSLHGTRGRPRQHVSDVLRGALVLAVGALDGLVLEASIEAVAPVAEAEGLGASYAKWVKDDPAAFWDALTRLDPPSAIAEVGRARLSTTTFQRSQMIEGVLRDVVGCDAPWANAANRLSRSGRAWAAEDVRKALDLIVERRHAIAHSGDLNPGLRATPITLRYVEEATNVVDAVGIAVCDVVNRRVRQVCRRPLPVE